MTSYMKTVDLSQGKIEEKRREILSYFLQTYDLDERLFDLLEDKKYIFKQPNHLRHPLIFYYGHTATFFINKLFLAKLIDKRVNEHFESIFAIGVDEMSWDDLNARHYDWPTFEEVKAYRAKVKTLISDLIMNIELTLPINWDSPMWVILMGIEHENIHIETSSVLLRELDLDYLKEDEYFLTCKDGNTHHYPTNTLLPVKGGDVVLGKAWDTPQFYGWDNEFGTHKSSLESFEASQYLVSNGEFMEFVKAGGYQNLGYFSEEGKRYLEFTKATMPKFWRHKEGEYFLRGINTLTHLPLNHPVEVSYYEAEAFCAWKSEKLGVEVRLPSEDEYYRLYDATEAHIHQANIGLMHFSACSVDTHAFGDFYDVRGNVWQWSLTPIYPFEGFKTHPYYDDFTTPTFDDRHALMKGGSFISLGNEELRSARYAFRKHFYQHCGFRYVHSNNAYATVLNENVYESDALLSQYCEFHYGATYFGVPNFPKTTVDLLEPYITSTQKALDLGCSVGRASFELARIFDTVTGIDFSANFINVGVRLQTQGEIAYHIAQEGDIVERKSVALKELGLDKFQHKVSFFQGDACNLKPIYTDYDLILCSNLIDRLHSPKAFLEEIGKRLNDGGILVILSPYTWLEEYTKKEKWLGGFEKNGKAVYTIDTLHEELSDFELLTCKEVPFIIKETSRKFQHTISQMSVWKKV